ncbi:MAG: CRTAC1 family protein [Planctomycetes bacterium]|nr:CRTAC1 family protein [Planctomycetota bacterium]
MSIRVVAAGFAVVALAGMVFVLAPRRPILVTPAVPPGTAAGPAVGDQVRRFEADRENLDRTLWKDERAAQAHEESFIRLWDQLRATADRLPLLQRFGIGEVTLGLLGEPEALGNGVIRTRCAGAGTHLDQRAWSSWLAALAADGLELVQCEFHHSKYTPAIYASRGATSQMAAVFHCENRRTSQRLIISGSLGIEWSAKLDADNLYAAEAIDATNLTILSRHGAPAFTEVPALSQLTGTDMSFLLVYDLDADGRSDLVYPSANLAMMNSGDCRFVPRTLSPRLRNRVSTALIADLTGDGLPDLLCCEGDDRKSVWSLVVYPGGAKGVFEQDGRRIDVPDLAFNAPTLTVGDIDGDGDLDLFQANNKVQYTQGQMPTPYFDANDGFPSHLLLNDGTGGFVDATDACGLGAKRHRRTYTASFIDLDDDADLDLVVVSDFSGVDLYRNDGKGLFDDVTADAVDERSLFGMAHCFGDFDRDGALDLYVTGMSSTTARRLHGLGLGRKELPRHDEMRPKMSYGNRMYAHTAPMRFRQPEWKDQVARTGWSWGCAAVDFDNDGDTDIYVANGNSSSRSARDYCSTYWCHDVYSGSSRPDPTLDLGFARAMRAKAEGGVSWNGFEHNVLFMNERAAGFVNVSFLMGVALEDDCRMAVADDLDGDGRMDLVVKSLEPVTTTSDLRRSRFRILRNRMPANGHWIGFRFRDEPGRRSPIGATVTVRTSGGIFIAPVVTGDAFYSQRALAAHIGLGANDRVESATIRWPNEATTTVIVAPAIDSWITVTR